MLFAEIASSNAISGWVTAGSAVLNFILIIVVLIQKVGGTPEKREIHPTPFPVVAGDKFVTQREFDKDIQDIKAMFAEIKADIREQWERFQTHSENHTDHEGRLSSLEAIAGIPISTKKGHKS